MDAAWTLRARRLAARLHRPRLSWACLALGVALVLASELLPLGPLRVVEAALVAAGALVAYRGLGLTGNRRELEDVSAARDELSVLLRRQEAVARLAQLTLTEIGEDDLLQLAADMVADRLHADGAAVLERVEDGSGLVERAVCSRTVRSARQAPTRVSAPIGLDGNAFGTLVAHRHDGRDFTERDSQFVNAVANVLGSAIRRRHAESELRQTHALFSAVVEGTTDAVFVKNLEGRFQLLNDPTANRLGTTRAAAIGRTVYDLLSREEADVMTDADRRVVSLGVPQTFEEAATVGGRRKVSLVTKGPVFDDAGRAVGVFGISRDITERSEQQAALTRSEERFRLAQQGARMGTWEMDLNGGGSIWSDGLYQLLGADPASEAGRVLYMSFVHPDDHDRVLDTVSSAMDRGEDCDVEHRIIRSDGETRWILGRATVLYDDDDNPSRALGVAVDLTERKLAEEELARNQTTFQIAEGVAGIGAWTWDIASGTVEMTPGMYDLFGLDRDFGVKVEDWVEYAHPDDRERFRRVFRHAVETASPYEDEFRAVSADGRQLWMQTRGSVVRDASGKPVRMVGVTMDVTARRHAEEAVRRSEELYRRVVEASLDPICLIAPTRRVVYLSSAGEQVLGYGPGEAEGLGVFDLLRPEERGPLEEALAAVFRGEAVDGLEFAARTRTGAEIVLESSATLVQGIGDGPDLVLLIARDTTDAKLAQEERLRLENRLRQAERMEAVGQLAGGIAHDFNNLLLALRGYGELALRRIARKEDGAEEDVQEMLEAADRAAGLTRQLLAFGRRQVLNPQVHDLGDVVAGVSEQVRRAVGDKIELVTIPPAVPVLVKADRGQLEQVITNLAENARDAMADGGLLTIGVSTAQLDPSLGAPAAADGLCAVLTVTDTGAGMDAETSARIFEPFFTTKGETSTGLGLATVHGIVTQSGGHLGVYTAVGKGSAFEVYLPLCGDRPVEPEAPAAPAEEQPGQSILLIEDDPNVRSIVQMMLEDRGYNVLSAGGGEDAIGLLEEHPAPVQLALSDLIMRGLNGRETVERLRERQPGLRVLYMSGYTNDAVVRDGGLDAGTGFIQKPFSGEELGKRIRELLETAA